MFYIQKFLPTLIILILLIVNNIILICIRTQHKIYPLSNFRVYSTVLTIGPVLGSSSTDLPCITETLCPLTFTSLFSPSPVPGIAHSTLCF